ncbi:MAG: uroporphyrinogen decarboxylase [Candidatus Xenobia bacterium]
MSKATRFLDAVTGRTPDCTPVWFMRQAGRYMAVYRKLREKHTLLELCRNPELACEVTLQPVDAFDLDAAIIFADILLPLAPMGVDFEFAKGEGPVIHQPVRTREQIEKLRPIDPEESLGYVLEAIRLVTRALNGRIPLIGFAGAPFTLASYMIEGGGSRHYIHTKRMMMEEPQLWDALMRHIVAVQSRFLRKQAEAGAAVVQIFDSWVGCLGPDDYERYVFPHMQTLFESLRGIPSIHFGTGNGELLPLMKAAGGDVIGLDWRIRLDEGWRRLGGGNVQGNLDPIALMGPEAELERRIRDILRYADGRPGHIFNLGHGILPETPEARVAFAADCVHRLSLSPVRS